MVKKLFKHEINFYLRTIIPMHLVLIGIAILSRFVQLFDNNSITYNIVFYSSVVAFCIGVAVCILLTLIFGIKRFYTNLFSSEGYLTLTLPVTTSQHIWVKNIVAVLIQLASLFMIFIAACCITFGDVCIEVFKAIAYVIKALYKPYGFHTTLFIIEFVIALVVTLSATYMLYYACIALGQRAKKNRVAAAVGIFFIYYLIVQVLSTIGIILINVVYEGTFIESILDYISRHTILALHSIGGTIIVLGVIQTIIYYVITRHSITKKLNIE